MLVKDSQLSHRVLASVLASLSLHLAQAQLEGACFRLDKIQLVALAQIRQVLVVLAQGLR